MYKMSSDVLISARDLVDELRCYNDLFKVGLKSCYLENILFALKHLTNVGLSKNYINDQKKEVICEIQLL